MHAEIALSELRYSQRSIRSTFQDGSWIRDTAHALKNGSLTWECVPWLRVVEVNGVYHSLDNRRLWCFKESLIPQTLLKVLLFTPGHPDHDNQMKDYRSKSKGRLVDEGKGVKVKNFFCFCSAENHHFSCVCIPDGDDRFDVNCVEACDRSDALCKLALCDHLANRQDGDDGLCTFCGNEDSSCICVPDGDYRFDENILGDEACDPSDVQCKLAVCDHLANRQDGDDDEDPWCEQCGILKEDCACSDSWLEDRFDEELFGDFACDPSDYECITGTCECFSY